jgi:hypothetical protein
MQNRRTLLSIIGSSALMTLLASSVMAGDAGTGGIAQILLDCTNYTGAAGSSCTVSSSNIEEIPVRTVLYHLQAANIVPGLLDTSIVYDAGNGNRMSGHCTTDLVSSIGVCLIMYGSGDLAGIEGYLDIAPVSPPAFSATGPYHFKDINHFFRNR